MRNLRQRLGREWPSLILAGAAAALGLNCLIGPRGLHDLLVLRQHRAASELARRQLRTEQAELQIEVHKLQSDDRYLQNLVRRELGFARPDELIYKFKSDSIPAAR